MSYDELNDEQRLELKQHILAERGEGVSYGELAFADDLVSDEDARAWAKGMEFSEDDFLCSAIEPPARVKDIPQWAIGYLVNSDPSGLTDENKQMVDRWVEKLADKGLELLCPIAGSENEFCSVPSFGLACGTVDFAARRKPQIKEDK